MMGVCLQAANMEYPANLGCRSPSLSEQMVRDSLPMDEIQQRQSCLGRIKGSQVDAWIALLRTAASLNEAPSLDAAVWWLHGEICGWLKA